jgi:beta-galactosidase
MIKRSLLLWVVTLLFLFTGSALAQKAKHNFKLGTSEFMLDGQPFQIISGEMHPARIPVEYWRHRIQMA